MSVIKVKNNGKWETIPIIGGITYTKEEADNKFVDVSGDTMTGNLTIETSVYGGQLEIKRTAANGSAAVKYSNSSEFLGYIGIGGTLDPTAPRDVYFEDKDNRVYKIWHAGNDGQGSGLAADTTYKLQTPRVINGTNFDGTTNITTTNWGEARNITIGNTKKSVNGSADVSWSLEEIGIDAYSKMEADNRYVNISGDTMTGTLTVVGNGATAFDNPGIIFGNNAARLGTDGYNSIGIYAGGKIVLRPGSTSASSGKGVDISDTDITYNGFRMWHSGNDGSGSQLDADTIDGYHANNLFTQNERLGNYNIDTIDLFGTRDIQPSSEITIDGKKPFNGWGTLLMFKSLQRASRLQLAFEGMNEPYIRYAYDSSDSITVDWKRLAFITSNVASATKLQTPRTINGTNFDGSANITTANWGTTRTLTIGNSGKPVNGSGNVSWSLSEIGAASSNHSHNSITASVAGANALNMLYASIADNDYFRLRVGGTAGDAGYVEFATADDGNEPIYVRQYTGVFATVRRTLTLLDGSGNSQFPGSVNAVSGFYEQSDIRLKTNIQPIDFTNNIELVSFNWKKDRSKSYGVIAQQVEQYYPELVSTDESTGYKSVNYDAVLIIKCAQLENRIKQLEKELEDLKNG